MKVVISKYYGDFRLSKTAKEMLGIKNSIEYAADEKRTDPKLVEVVEKLGAAASKPFSRLKVIEIPDDVEWSIEDHDGFEWIVEAHRAWL